MSKFVLIATLFFIPALASADYYTVLMSDYSDLIVYDGSTAYSLNTNWECTSSDFSQGDVIFIDDLISPSYGDAIVFEGLFDVEACEVSSSNQLNLKEYFLDTEAGSDNIIVTDSWGDQYLVEYGIGCLSMWRYVDDYIYIDIGGAFLDGIGDEIYLLDSGDTCKVWDADELNGSSGGGYASFTDSEEYSKAMNEMLEDELGTIYMQSTCPDNARYRDGGCYCDDNYFADGDSCVSGDTLCQRIDSNSFWHTISQECSCSRGFELDEDTNLCVDEEVVLAKTVEEESSEPTVVPVESKPILLPVQTTQEPVYIEEPKFDENQNLEVVERAPLDDQSETSITSTYDEFDPATSTEEQPLISDTEREENVQKRLDEKREKNISEDNETRTSLLKRIISFFTRWF